MDPVTVPAHVAEAFDYHRKAWRSLDFERSKILFMLLPANGAANPYTETLKQYALKCPTHYMKAILYGYKPQVDLKTEIAEILDDWLNKPWREGKQTELERIATELIHHIQKSS